MSKQNCFVISPIGEPSSETRKRSDQIFKHVITPAVEDEYKPIRADHISEPGLITAQVIQHIVDDPLVIADLTEKNPNVFYELAIRHALKKPLVQIIKKGETIPFDVAGTRTIYIDHKDLDSVETAITEISAQVGAIKKDGFEIETPISISLDLQTLKSSEKPEDKYLNDILSTVTELRNGLVSIEQKVEDPEKLFPPDYVKYVIDRVSHAGMHRPHFIFEVRDFVEFLIDKLKDIEERTQSETIIQEVYNIRDKADNIRKMAIDYMRHL